MWTHTKPHPFVTYPYWVDNDAECGYCSNPARAHGCIVTEDGVEFPVCPGDHIMEKDGVRINVHIVDLPKTSRKE